LEVRAMRFIQYEVSDNDDSKILWLLSQTGSKDERKLIDIALTLLQWAIEQTQNGRQVASLDMESRSYRRLQMHALDAVSATGQEEAVA
jgi:hypothetical protein